MHGVVGILAEGWEEMPLGSKVVVVSRVLLMLVLCGVIFGGHHPPAMAQRQREIVPVLTVKDAQQDDHLENTDRNVQDLRDAIRERMDKLDIRIDHVETRADSNRSEVHDTQTKITIWGGILAGLAAPGFLVPLIGFFMKLPRHRA